MSDSESDTEQKNLIELASTSRKLARKKANHRYYLNKSKKHKKYNDSEQNTDNLNIENSELSISQKNTSYLNLDSSINQIDTSSPYSDIYSNISIDQFSEDDQFIPSIYESSLSDLSVSSDTFSEENDSLKIDQGKFIYDDSNITLNEFAYSLMLIKFRHKLSEAAVDDILNLIKIIIPSPNNCPKTSSTLIKNIPNNVNVTDFLVCNNCKRYIPFTKMKTCESCSIGELIQFSTFDIIPQIQKIVSNEKYFNQIKTANSRIRKNQLVPPTEILSALDGKLISSLPQNNELYLSVDINSDGAPTIKSRQFSLWPVLGRIVELNQSSRDKFDNIIILGDWLHQSKPLEIYYEKAFQQLEKLKNTTVKFT